MSMAAPSTLRRAAGMAVIALFAALSTVGTSVTPAAADGNEAPGNPLASRSISAGAFHSCALLTNGTVKCWGSGTRGQLGQDSTATLGDAPGEMAALDPVNLGAGRTATAITAGANHTCALLDNNTVKCWGSGSSGRLGQDSGDDLGDAPGEMAALDPVNLGAGRTATAITAGDSHTCALLDNNTVTCWGSGSSGRLGQDSTATLGDTPGEMAALDPVNLGAGRTAIAVTAGGAHTCALLDNNTVTCWGAGADGQLGQDSTATLGDQPGEMAALNPVNLGAGRTATAITAGNAHTCALLDNNTVKCWGAGSSGRLGQDSSTALGDAPGEMAALGPVNLGAGRTATAVTVGDFHTCALLDNNTVTCWGFGSSGRLGQDSTATLGDNPGEMAALDPVNLGAGRTATAVTAGGAHTCALLDNNTVKCWGAGGNGRLGQDSTADLGDAQGEMAALPVAVILRAAVQVSVTADQTSVVAGAVIDYHLTVTNTGGIPLTTVEVLAPDVSDCGGPIPNLSLGAAHIVDCSYTTTDDDVGTMTNQVLVTTAQGAFGLSGTRRTRVNAQVIRPDGQVRLGVGAFAGTTTYNTTGAGQTRSTTVGNRGTASFTARIQNDGNVTDDITLLGQSTTARYTVTYKDGPTNITGAVVAGTFTLDDLAPGATRDITITIRAKAGTPVGNTISRTLTATSTTTPTVKDTVKTTVRRT